jgi:hypothetical protein
MTLLAEAYRPDKSEAAEQRRNAEAWASLNLFVSQCGAWVVSPPSARGIRIEAPPSSDVASRLCRLGFNVREQGCSTRTTEKDVASPVDVLIVNLDGR